ncbi:MAG: SO2930 family diheme c-type cytochrome [Myxococcota bacterium]
MFQAFRCAFLGVIALGLLAAPAAAKNPFKGWTVVEVESGPGALDSLKTAFATAVPETIIQLPKGTIQVDSELVLASSHVLVKGKNPKKTILDFSGQVSGGQGILISGDWVTFQNFTVLNTPGDGIRAQREGGIVQGVTFEKMKVEFNTLPEEDRGAYGLYPVQCNGVRVEKSEVIGAADAGIYVGQSNNIIVTKNKVHGNVAGIEIENSFDADVFKNKTYNNTAGILVFNLPGLSQEGERTRVYQNKVTDNNYRNFASGIVGDVPPGTGMLILANDQVEIFKNKISGHVTVGIAPVSYDFVSGSEGAEPPPPPFEPHPETIYIYKNKYKNNGADPQGAVGLILNAQLGGGEDIVSDSDEDETKFVDGVLPDEFRVCIQEKKATYASLNLSGLANGEPVETGRDILVHDCEHPELAPVVLPEMPPAPPAEVTARCTGGEDAYLADCPRLDQYGLFDGNDPRVPGPGGLPFDLTTPLFTDYTVKYRQVYLPDGTTADFSPDGPFDFPVGTIIAKTFAMPIDLTADPVEDDVIETRLLMHRPNGWAAVPYVWDPTDTEARLAIIGDVQELTWTHSDGMERTTQYGVPSKNQCTRCHVSSAPIGPRATVLNDDYDYDGDGTPEENQLVHWEAEGKLSGLPVDLGTVDRIPVWNHNGENGTPVDGTLEERARGYLDSNCAHCHKMGGQAGSTSLWLGWDEDPTGFNYGVCKTPIAAGIIATDGRSHDIIPGQPDASILMYRMESTLPAAAMPEIGRSVNHDEGNALVREWIAALAPGPCS